MNTIDKMYLNTQVRVGKMKDSIKDFYPAIL